MRAILKNVYCCDGELENIAVDENGDLGVELVLDIGILNSEESQVFNVFICTASYLQNFTSKPRLITNTILVDDFDIKQIKQLIENNLMYCKGDNWQEIKQKISTIFPY